jgi:hypothetical protein
MLALNLLGNIEPLNIYVAQPSGFPLGCLNDEIDTNSANISLCLNQQYSLSFDITKDPNKKNAWYDYLHEGMYLLVEKIGLFKINQPDLKVDGNKETKSISAISCDVELEDKNCLFCANMGTETSLEYLIEYEENESEVLLNPYTNIPYDWIVLYNTFPEQLNELQVALSQNKYGVISNGNIIVTDDNEIQQLQKIIDLIPRLKHSCTVNSEGENQITTFVECEYNLDKDVSKIILRDGFTSRIESLIEFYTKYRNQLSLLTLVLEATDGAWSVGDFINIEDGDYSLVNTKCQFEIDENIYSFLTQTLAQAIKCIVNFDITNRKVNVIPIEKIGEDTGIVLSYDNLLNTFNATGEEERLATRLYVTGADDLDISLVNFGQNYIEDLSYKMNIKDVNGNRIYVDDTLASKYQQYIEDKESYREAYIFYSKEYERILKEIDEIKYRVPVDDLKTDWGTFSQEELDAALITYNNLLATLQTLYKEDFGSTGLNSDGSINENFIKTTIYWYDYKAYLNIINEIKCAIDTFPYYSDQSKWSDRNISEYKELISQWETEWSLYGIIELTNKIEIYKTEMNLLSENSVIKVSENDVDWSNVIDKSIYNNDEDYYYYGIKQWNELSSSEKSKFGNLEEKYYYTTYNTYYENYISAKAYLSILQTQFNELTESLNNVLNLRTEIVTKVQIQNYISADGVYFTDKEIKTLNRLYRDSDYNNSNFLLTNITTTDEKIEIMRELLKDAQTMASQLSRPQLNINIEVDNLLGLPEFKSFWTNFKNGNYMYIQYKDDTYVKLRMVSFKFNPLLPSSTDFSISFSNYIYSKNGISDIGYFLGDSSSSSGGHSGSSSNSNGVYGVSDDIDVTISNTMLAKLLNSESFGSRVSNIILDTVKVNVLTAKTATFEDCATGKTIIDGGCIQTGSIKSNNYDEINKTGSILQLEDGSFRFGGDSLVYQYSPSTQIGKLSVKGDINATSLSTGNKISSISAANGIYIDENGNLYAGSNNDVLIKGDGTFNFGNGKLVYSNNILSINGSITSNYTGTNYTQASILNAGSLTFERNELRHGRIDAGAIFDENGNETNKTLGLVTDNDAIIAFGYFTEDSVKLHSQLDKNGNLSLGGNLSTKNIDSYGNLYVSGNISTDGKITSWGSITTEDSLFITSGYGLKLKDDTRNSWLVHFDYGTNLGEDIVKIGSNSRKTSLYSSDNKIWSQGSATNYFSTSSDSSDKRLKQEICDLSIYENFFTKIRPVAYKFHEGLYNPKSTEAKINWGFYAQDVLEAYNENGIDWTKESFLSIKDTELTNGEKEYIDDNILYQLSYQNMIALNTHMIQKVISKVTSLKQEVEILKTEKE